MSSALVLAAATALVRHILENGLVERGITAALGGDVQVSAQAPDRVKVGSDERPQLNLFLYHVDTKGVSPSSRYAPGSPRPVVPLTIECYYLLVAYGAQDFQMEVLLGCGMELLHRSPAFDNAGVRRILDSVSSPGDGRVVPPPLASLQASGLAERVEQVRISANEMTHESMTNLWSSLQAPYRPTRSYKVTLTLSGGFEPPQEP